MIGIGVTLIVIGLCLLPFVSYSDQDLCGNLIILGAVLVLLNVAWILGVMFYHSEACMSWLKWWFTWGF